MNWDFKNAEELLNLCHDKKKPISEVMIRREMQLGEIRRSTLIEQVDGILRVMNTAVDRPISEPARSMGGLIGGEANKLNRLDESKAVCGPVIHRAIVNALAVAETNASMGVIVAAPTAGSAGVLPAVLMSLYESYDISVDAIRKGLINAGAIGYIITRNGSVAGAEAGCQAEVGSASAMAASAASRCAVVVFASSREASRASGTLTCSSSFILFMVRPPRTRFANQPVPS